MRPPVRSLQRVLKILWTALGLSGLILLAWAEPWSSRLFSASGAPSWFIDYAAVPLVMVFRAVIIVEAFGYVYHRFFQHLGFWTRRARLFRRNQKYHWIHHMIIYPIGRFYRRELPYVPAEPGIAWSWVVPAALAIALALWTLGPHTGTYVFIAAIAAYAKLVVDNVHSRFHEARHSWQENRYFQRLEKIHVLHHWDQRRNFTIVHPLMDMLFGTYLSPSDHPRQLQAALEDLELKVSDLINWRYLLLEATPAEYAAFISTARRHPGSIRKVGRLTEILDLRLERFPDDGEARELRGRASELLALVRST